MFQPAADVLSWRDLEAPAPSHPTEFPEWKEHTDESLGDMLDVLSEEEREGFDVAQLITYRALEKFVAKATAVGWSGLSAEERREMALNVLMRPQIPQRTSAWYAQGKEVLTASEFAKLLGSPRAVAQLIQSKVPTAVAPMQSNRLACMTCEMGPFDWGIRFEPVVKQILEAKWGLHIAEAGRIVHPTDSHIAASPDGIILAATDPQRVGRLLEIKCPITRAIGGGVPFDYWCQMQVQMEVTGIDECEYVEVKIDSLGRAVTDLSGAEGFVWLLQDPATCVMQYAYTEAETEGLEILEKIPWRLGGMYAVTVARDRGWFQQTAELRETFWRKVKEARQMPESPMVIVIKEAACLIVD
jgi:hypothetical protein